jgi:Pyridoxamine 5'-phosphate oxidase
MGQRNGSQDRVEPTSAQALVPDEGEAFAAEASAWLRDTSTPTPWDTVRQLLQKESATYWLATVGSKHRPHLVPVMAVWDDGRLFFSANATTRKARNLDHDPHCVISVEIEPFDLVVEGTASRTRDTATLERVAAVYASVHGWRVAVNNGLFDGVAGAPTAGPPPYGVYRVTPTTAFAFPLDPTVTPTRWRFGSS